MRDTVDKRIIENVRTGTYTAEGSNGSSKGIIDSQCDVGGWPELKSTETPIDTDNDGMPDEWEIKMKLDPDKVNANDRDLSSAYDNIEVYINSLVYEIINGQN